MYVCVITHVTLIFLVFLLAIGVTCPEDLFELKVSNTDSWSQLQTCSPAAHAESINEEFTSNVGIGNGDKGAGLSQTTRDRCAL